MVAETETVAEPAPLAIPAVRLDALIQTANRSLAPLSAAPPVAPAPRPAGITITLRPRPWLRARAGRLARRLPRQPSR